MLEFIQKILGAVSSFAVYDLLPAVLIFVGGYLIITIVLKLLDKLLGKSKFEQAAVSLILSVIRVVLFIVLSLIVASSLGIDVTGIVALASVLTLAVSLSVQDALSNLIGGFTLLYTKPFKIGDFVQIGGESGTVQQIGLTYTKLLTPDSKTVSMPNKSVVASQIVNYTVAGVRRVEISVGVSYNANPDLVLEALIQAADVPTALKDPAPYSAIATYGGSTVGYILHVWSTADDYWTTLHTVNRNIRAVFTEKNVAMTYPHLNVHLDK